MVENKNTKADNLRNILSNQNDQELSDSLAKGGEYEILDVLSEKDSFDEEIEQILANFNEQTMDLTKLQTQIILLIKKYLNSSKYKNKSIKIDESVIAENIAEVSHHLINQRSEIIKNANKELGVADSKDNYQAITNQSRSDIKKIIKNFAVYEIYKVMNPKRIAGETRKENFAHNVITGGIDHAKHYAGGTKAEIENYSPQFVKKLETKHQSFKKNPVIGR